MGRHRKNSGTQVEKIPISYDKCGEDIENLLKDLISQYKTDLVNCKFALLYKNREIKRKDQIVFATVQKTGPKIKALTEYDYIITIAYPTWNALSDLERRSVLHHELCHCFVEDDEKTGEEKKQIIPHDFENFYEIAKHYGTSSVTFGRLASVLEEVLVAKKTL
jgi:hypothetical protein